MAIDVIDVNVDQLKRMLLVNVHFLLIDIRSPDEFAKGTIGKAINVSEKDFLNQTEEILKTKNMPAVIFDTDGTTTPKICTAAEEKGFINVCFLAGGFAAFK